MCFFFELRICLELHTNIGNEVLFYTFIILEVELYLYNIEFNCEDNLYLSFVCNIVSFKLFLSYILLLEF